LREELNVESLAVKRAFLSGAEARVRNPIRKVTDWLGNTGHRPNFVRFIVILLLCCAFCGLVSGHDISQSESHIEVRGHEVQVAFRLNLLELGYVDANGNGFISYDELDNSIGRIYADIKQHYVLQSPEFPIRVTLKRYGVVEDHVLDAEIIYEFPSEVKQLRVTSSLHQITRSGHQHLTSANLNGIIHEAVINAANPTVVFSSDDASTVKTFWSFFRLGIMHIFTGYDHLAFLVGLLIVTKGLASLVKIITSFTVAHSITLALATFNIVVLPTRLTESVIALSIVYVALENLLGIRAIERYRITFLFGLAHGFGFSNVLREMELSRLHLGLSLFSFNLGVEIGQLAFVLVLFPLILYIATVSWRRQFQKAVSLIVMCLAAYWFVQRAFAI
jgi:hydrogenase/urease accessory protein HupE